MKTILFLLIITVSLPVRSQETLSSESWKKYSRKTQIELGVLNMSYMVFMTTKQEFIPYPTQKWLVPAISVPVIGITFFKTIEFYKRKPVTIRNNYKPKL